jgi:hypothetical protein
VNRVSDDVEAATAIPWEPISPELVLVSPELRDLAIAALPPIQLDVRRPLPPAVVPTPRRHDQRVGVLLRGVVGLGLVAFSICTIGVLTLTLIADALR